MSDEPAISDEIALRKVLSSAPRPRPASAASAALAFGWRGMLNFLDLAPPREALEDLERSAPGG